jgi:hypothetical protein
MFNKFHKHMSASNPYTIAAVPTAGRGGIRGHAVGPPANMHIPVEEIGEEYCIPMHMRHMLMHSGTALWPYDWLCQRILLPENTDVQVNWIGMKPDWVGITRMAIELVADEVTDSNTGKPWSIEMHYDQFTRPRFFNRITRMANTRRAQVFSSYAESVTVIPIYRWS